MDKGSLRGLTLIELAIVLVVIGLVVGGVLVGRDLINAAAVRAQISQIEKYNADVNTFRNKYGYLPGDIGGPVAAEPKVRFNGSDHSNQLISLGSCRKPSYDAKCRYLAEKPGFAPQNPT